MCVGNENIHQTIGRLQTSTRNYFQNIGMNFLYGCISKLAAVIKLVETMRLRGESIDEQAFIRLLL